MDSSILVAEGVASFFNTNPYFIGVMMLILNLGGRFISLEVTKGQETFFQNPWFRRFLIFTVLFVATRNILVSALMTFVITLFIGYLFNENSSLCLFGKGNNKLSYCSKDDKTTEKPISMSVEEMEILNRLQAKSQKFLAAGERKEEEDLSSKIYSTNLNLLQLR